MKPAPQTAFPLDSTPSNAAGKVEGAEMSSEEFLAMLDATCAKLIERQKLKGWRPIEEAPKDGTRVLLLLEGADCAIGNWNKDAFDGPMWEDDSLEPVPFILTPTHFQPLPEPPTL